MENILMFPSRDNLDTHFLNEVRVNRVEIPEISLNDPRARTV